MLITFVVELCGIICLLWAGPLMTGLDTPIQGPLAHPATASAQDPNSETGRWLLTEEHLVRETRFTAQSMPEISRRCL